MNQAIDNIQTVFHKQLSALELSTIDVQHTSEFDSAVALLESDAPCIFITGEAGTGKSTLLKYFVANTQKRVVLVAPTGVAALNIGGQTIHSFFRFPPGPINQIEKLPYKGEILRAIDMLIIDEISMVRADLLDAIDQFLRLNLDQPEKPFGGLQVAFFGDLFQLPPVVRESEEGQFFSQYYRSPYFFDAHVFNSLEISLIKLMAIYRQSDPRFMDALKHIRINRIHTEHLEMLNQRVRVNFDSSVEGGYITLTTTNHRADEKNQRELRRLPATGMGYQASLQGDVAKSQGKTLDRAIIDFSGGTFAHGQAYVAISRLSSLDGMILKTPIRATDIIVDSRVFQFINRLTQRQAQAH